MKVFVGYGYNTQDEWIENLIIPFIEELGFNVVTGEEMQGDRLSEGVIERISQSDVCIGFLTRRGQANTEGIFATHSWVISELTVALTKGIPLFELREKGIDPQKGILGDRQRYEFEDKAQLLLELTKFLNKERSRLTYKTLMLLPNEFSSEIRPHLKSRDTRCEYKFWYKDKEYGPEEAKLQRLGAGGLAVVIKKIPNEEALVEVTVEGPGGINWSSGFISVGLMNVHLQKN